STQPTVTKMAEDRAEQLKRDPDAVAQEVDKRIRNDVQKKGEFSRIHPLPHSGAEVPDDLDARLVVLGIDYPYSKEEGNPAEKAAKAIFENRGNTPRLYRNTLVFLAVDKNRLQDLDDAVRRYLAWESILTEKEELDLSPHQVKQAETQRNAVDGAVTARLPEAYQWLLVPVQNTPQDTIKWQSYRMSGQDALAVRASKKLINDELLVTKLACTRLRMELDRIPLWRGNHVEIKQIVEDFARYLYLPRLKNVEVLLDALHNGFDLFTWEQDSFAYAESFDDKLNRYRGLRAGQSVSLNNNFMGLLVHPEIAIKQIDEEAKRVQPPPGGGSGQTPPDVPKDKPSIDEPEIPTEPAKPKRYHGTVSLDPTRTVRDVGKIAEEVISHLVGIVGSNVRVTMEIEADIPNGAPDNVVRIVTENGRTLKFTNHGFEME
ncbi:MAG: AAA+ family ATPase, partial [Candidatus Hinthialibacter sp.]